MPEKSFAFNISGYSAVISLKSRFSSEACKSNLLLISPPVAKIFPEPKLNSDLFTAVKPASSPMSMSPVTGRPLIFPSTSILKFTRSAPISFTSTTPYLEENLLSFRLNLSNGISGIAFLFSFSSSAYAAVMNEELGLRFEERGVNVNLSFNFSTVFNKLSTSMSIPPSAISASLIFPVKRAGKFMRPDKNPADKIF